MLSVRTVSPSSRPGTPGDASFQYASFPGFEIAEPSATTAVGESGSHSNLFHDGVGPADAATQMAQLPPAAGAAAVGDEYSYLRMPPRPRLLATEEDSSLLMKRFKELKLQSTVTMRNAFGLQTDVRKFVKSQKSHSRERGRILITEGHLPGFPEPELPVNDHSLPEEEEGDHLLRNQQQQQPQNNPPSTRMQVQQSPAQQRAPESSREGNVSPMRRSRVGFDQPGFPTGAAAGPASSRDLPLSHRSSVSGSTSLGGGTGSASGAGLSSSSRPPTQAGSFSHNSADDSSRSLGTASARSGEVRISSTGIPVVRRKKSLRPDADALVKQRLREDEERNRRMEQNRLLLLLESEDGSDGLELRRQLVQNQRNALAKKKLGAALNLSAYAVSRDVEEQILKQATAPTDDMPQLEVNDDEDYWKFFLQSFVVVEKELKESMVLHDRELKKLLMALRDEVLKLSKMSAVTSPDEVASLFTYVVEKHEEKYSIHAGLETKQELIRQRQLQAATCRRLAFEIKTMSAKIQKERLEKLRRLHRKQQQQQQQQQGKHLFGSGSFSATGQQQQQNMQSLEDRAIENANAFLEVACAVRYRDERGSAL